MEIAVFICMMIVPILSVAALVLSLSSLRRLGALKKLVVDYIQLNNQPRTPAEEMLQGYYMNSV